MPPAIRTERLCLRPVATRDLPEIARLIGDFDVAKMLSVVPHPYAVEDAWTWFRQTAAAAEDGERAFAIEVGGRPAGVISVGKPAAQPELGYWLGKPYWGQGVMTEAGRSVLAWLFDTSDTETVVSGALDENAGSLNVLTKLGFGEAHPYVIPVRSRGKDVAATRVRLHCERFRSLQKADA